MKAKRRRHETTFKARVALEALKGIKTIQQIATEYEVHPVQVSEWKKILVEGMGAAFERGKAKGGDEFEKERQVLERKIGQLSMDVDFLQKKSRQLGL
jgi:transposase-like protein